MIMIFILSVFWYDKFVTHSFSLYKDKILLKDEFYHSPRTCLKLLSY